MNARGLIYVTGPMGAGKSLYGTRRILRTIMAGRYVISNIALLAGWNYKLAWHTPQGFCKWVVWRLSGKRVKWFEKQAEFYATVYIHETNLERATAFNPYGKKEAAADLVWDELQRDMNNRTWFDENQNYVNQWATHLRKLGFAAFFLAQHKDNTDAALRRIANFEVRLRNQRELVRIAGFRLPFSFFLAQWFPANVKKLKGEDIMQTERYFRGWESRCYDTHAIHYDIDAEDTLLGIGTIQLPKPGELTAGQLQELRDRWNLEYAKRAAERAAALEESEASGANGARRKSARNGRIRTTSASRVVASANGKAKTPVSEGFRLVHRGVTVRTVPRGRG